MDIFLSHTPEAFANYYGERALAELAKSGDVKRNPHARVLSSDELIAHARACAVIVADRQTAAERRVFESLADLVAFVRVAVDIRNIDVEAASHHGVLVTRASPGFVPAVCEWILGAMVDASRHLTDYASQYRKGTPPPARMGTQLAGRTLGLIGLGAIGSRLSQLALALGMRVLVHDPYKGAPPPLRPVTLPELLAQADFVVPLAVATPETENLIDAHALTQMQRGAWLINASRGNLVDEAALERALDEQRIAGAVLDVGRAPDQMPSPHLARRPDVIATPHIAGLTPEAIAHQAMETARQVAAIARGETPEGAVNSGQASRLARLRRNG
jgi:D-3-phosphoglycerate dehydrogenase